MKNNLENTFKKLENQFDIEEPAIGHFNRFETKLNKLNKKNNFKLFKIAGILSMAATVLLFFGIWIGSTINKNGANLSSISPKMNETESYFVNTIQNEIYLIEKEKNRSNETIINDAFNQLKILENQYKKLTLDFKNNRSDSRIINAMIANYQQRLMVLKNLMLQINDVKQIKSQSHEKYI